MSATHLSGQDTLLGRSQDVFRPAAQNSTTTSTTAGMQAFNHDGLGFLTAQTAIPVSPLTPTVTEFLNAAISEYVIGGVPAGMTPFTVGGQQMTYYDTLTGAVAHAWVSAEHQVVISYAGTTGGENLLLNPLLTAGGLISDLQIYSQQVSTAQTESLAFARSVIAAANAQGYANSQIFVTGHSLGGIEASYVAQQTGLGGIAFEATGIPAASGAVGKGTNFVSVVTDGDPVGNYSTDIQGEQPFAPAYVPTSQGGGSYAHYGTILQIGSAADQAALTTAATLTTNLLTSVVGVADLVSLIAEFHLPKSLYTDLDVTATGNLLATLPSNIGVAHGAVLPVSGDTIGQLQAYISTHATTTA
ncbi:putative esterase [Endobacter medicaginis]|uniref:Lipase n=1 Tax=Endobacter medicaginis TaxID=1181271 RepID=A0A850NRR5_9PROT|nr:lipase [Endobacter medicaginis]MBB3173555.1 putative esterase [Endobacter medicaginis]MCX5475356.1 lipase [Endobacter medicaginis]NVN29985.1 lipase [Endobacter medicaginis]